MRGALHSNLIIMAMRDLLSKKVRLVLNLLGIVIGVSALLFLLSLTEGIRRGVLKALVGSIPITEMTATPAEIDQPLGAIERLLAERAGVRQAENVVVKRRLRNDDLTDETIAQVEAIPGVKRVFGVKTLKRVPTSVEGWLFGMGKAHFDTEAVVFGYPPELLVGDVKNLDEYHYKDEEALDKFPVPFSLRDVVLQAVFQARIDIARVDGHFVPAVISRHLVEAYNISYAGEQTYGLTEHISEESLIGQYMYVRLGRRSAFFESPTKEAALRGALIKVVGLSDRVPMLGFGVPPEYIAVWEKAYFKEPMPVVYQQLVIQARSPADVDPVRETLMPVGWRLRKMRQDKRLTVEAAADLARLDVRSVRSIEAGIIRRVVDNEDEARKLVCTYARALGADTNEIGKAFDLGLELDVESQKETIDKINLVTLIVRFAFVLIVAIILGITAVGILNVLTMSVYEERVDIGILRSVGARQGHVRFIYIWKAFMIGLMGSLAGLLLGWLAMRGGDALAHAFLPRIPYMPQTLFRAQWEFVAISLAMGIGFALIAGISPSNHAAKLNPSVVLRGA